MVILALAIAYALKYDIEYELEMAAAPVEVDVNDVNDVIADLDEVRCR